MHQQQRATRPCRQPRPHHQWLAIVGLHLRAGLGWQAAATVDGAFWIGDLVKLAATVLVAAAVHRAFPALLRRRA